MKKVLICILLMGITAVTTTAQQQLPLDPKIKVGKLDNGLTYILRHNEKPAGQADFYIAQRVGSILENDDQQVLPISLNTCVSTAQSTSPARA